jgi:peptidoglycan/LPS O-acetylase OafA/YrhL
MHNDDHRRGTTVTHRRDIEGLRAIAVIAVLAYHAGVPGMAGGFVGVDSFLVISGFLITGLLIDEHERTGRLNLMSFYARRARRLLPISTVVLAVTALVAAFVMPATALRSLGIDIAASAGFGLNVVLAARGTDYLAGDVDPSAIQHFWSLAVEEQFYLVWPALIAVITIGATRPRRRIGIMTGCIVTASLALSIALSASAPTWSYFGLHTRAWELGVGALLAVAVRGRYVDRPLPVVGGWLALAGLIVAVVICGEAAAFPGWVAVLPVGTTAALILVGSHASRHSVANVLSLQPLQWIGARSYSLYLWHWPALVLAPHILDRTLTPLDTVGVVAIAVALSAVGHRLVENPIRFATQLTTRPGRSLALGLGLIVIALSAGVATIVRQPDLATGVVAAAPEAIAPTTTVPVTTTSIAISDHSTTSTPTSTTVPPPPPRIDNRSDAAPAAVLAALDALVLPDNVRPSIYEANGDTASLYNTRCHQFLEASVAAPCVFGAVDGDFTIGLLGDSHAAQWFDPINTIAATNGWRLIAHTQGGCPIIDAVTWNRGAGTMLTQCGPWRNAVLDEFADEGVDVVITSQHWGLLSSPDGAALPASEWETGLPALFDRIRAGGAEPILLLDTPDPADSTPACASSHRNDLRPCEPGRLRTAEREVRAAAAASADTHEVGIIDPHRWLCVDTTPDDDDDTSRCPVVVGDILVYRDSHHLTNTIAQWLTPLLDAQLVPWLTAQANS